MESSWGRNTFPANIESVLKLADRKIDEITFFVYVAGAWRSIPEWRGPSGTAEDRTGCGREEKDDDIVT